MKKTLPIKIEWKLFEKAKEYRETDELTMPGLIQWYIENNRLVEIPVVRTVTKKNKIKEYKQEFQFKYTSLQLEVEQIDTLLFLYPTIAMNRIVEAVLYDYVRSREPIWVHSYFDDFSFFNKYGYRDEEFIKAYKRLTEEFPILTQREYEKNRRANEPTLYALRKKYGNYMKFKENMAKIEVKQLRDS